MTYQNREWVTQTEFSVTDDFLEHTQQEKLEDFFTSNQFPWLLTLDAITGGKKLNSAVGFYHTFLYDQKIISPFYQQLSPLIESLVHKNLNSEKMFRCRAGLFVQNQNKMIHECHVDANFDHITAIYYVVDSDGDLTIYQETVSQYPFSKPAMPEPVHLVQPKKGRLVIFNGDHFHSTANPTCYDLRIAITMNFYR
jgi:hypothetical protein